MFHRTGVKDKRILFGLLSAANNKDDEKSDEQEYPKQRRRLDLYRFLLVNSFLLFLHKSKSEMNNRVKATVITATEA